MKKNLRMLLSATMAVSIFFFLISCKKENERLVQTAPEIKNKSFFTRIEASGVQRAKDLIDTVISICKINDLTSHFSDAVIRKYGYPRWDLTVTLQNENGLKTLLVPVVDTADRVRLIISAYQQSNDKFLFKMIAKDMQQLGLPKYSKDNKVFTSQSLAGIFNSLEKQVIASKNLSHSPSSDIETNGTIFYQFCWTISILYDNGEVEVHNWQCITQIILTPSAYGSINSVPGIPDIGGGGGGGGGDEISQLIKYKCNCNCLEIDLFELFSQNFEPKWGQIGDQSTILKEIRKQMTFDHSFSTKSLDKQLAEMANYFNKNRLFTRNSTGNLVDAKNSQKVDRYIYSEKHGWIDMHHFFYAAQLACETNRVVSFLSLSVGEIIQKIIGTRSSSAFSYEDMPSNALGIDFYLRYKDKLSAKIINFDNAIQEYLMDIKITDPHDAPNFDFLPHILDEFVPKNTSTKGLIGDALYQAAFSEFCKKSLSTRNNIIEAHLLISFSSNK